MKYTCAECNCSIKGNIFRCADLNTCSYKCSYLVINRIKKVDPSLKEPSNWNFINNNVLLKNNVLNNDCGLDLSNINISSPVIYEDIDIIYKFKIDKNKLINKICGYVIVLVGIISYVYN